MSLLAKIWKERHRSLKAMAASVLPGSHHVDDVLQEAFARVLKSNREFGSHADAYKYLRTSVMTTAIDFYRRLKRRSQIFHTCDMRDAYLPSPVHENPLSRLIRLEEIDRKNSLMEEVNAAVENLLPEQREAIRAFFGKHREASLKEYCMETGVSYSTLRSRMLKGIDRIREQLKDREVEGFGIDGENQP